MVSPALLATTLLASVAIVAAQQNGGGGQRPPQQPPQGGQRGGGNNNGQYAYSYNGPAECTQPKVRREFREYSAEQRDRFVQAIMCLRRQPTKLPASVRSPSAYDDFVYVHWQANDHAHNTANFPPWHAGFLMMFETALSTCGWTDPLPYWDWSYDSQAPERSDIWNPRWFGGNGNGNCIPNGPYANQRATFPTPHCINRNFQGRDPRTGAAIMGAQFSPVEMEFMIDVETYSQVRESLENIPHNTIHNDVGGDMSDPRTSTNDPIFFLHHCNIDRWWRRWQSTHPQVALTYSGPTAPNMGNDARPTDLLRYFGLWADTPVSEALNNRGGMGATLPLLNPTAMLVALPLAVNPKAVNPKAVNPKAVNPEAVNPKAVNPKAVNPEAVNPRAVKARVKAR
ncbi:hypothetical protein HK104_004687, partial [Borealophlyctis nickersoniae]